MDSIATALTNSANAYFWTQSVENASVFLCVLPVSLAVSFFIFKAGKAIFKC